MARSSRGTTLGWGIVFLAICSVWLVLMLSNRTITLSLFFLGRQTLPLPVGLWLFGAFVVGNGVSFSILSFLQWTIVRLAQDQGRRGGQVPSRNAGRAAPEWEEDEEDEEDEFDWEEPPVPQPSTQAPTSPAQSAQTTATKQPQADRSPEQEDERLETVAENSPSSPPPADPGKVYEAPPPPRQGQQQGSNYSYQYRPARRTQEPADRPPVSPSSRPSPSRKPQAGGVPQKVVDVNYRVINPGSVTPSPRSSEGNKGNDRRGDNQGRTVQGWDDSDNAEDW